MRPFIWLVVLVTAAACDGNLATAGRVYASRNADSSRIYVDEPFPSIDNLIQVDSAVVWVFQRPSDRTTDTTRQVLYSERTLSGHCGFFRTSQTAPPVAFEALIQVNKAGFKDAVRRFRHDSIATHHVLIVLAPTNRTALSGSASAPCS